MNKVVRIGAGSGFAFDSATSVLQMLRTKPRPDYLIFEHMAEGSLSMYQRMREQFPGTGYSTALLDIHIGLHLDKILKAGIKIITNGGGMNPKGAAEAVRKRAEELGVSVKIAVVEGDDVREIVQERAKDGLEDMFSGEAVPSELISANAYLGGFPIAQALGMGADIVITGRVVDSALALGPLIHEFGWTENDFDQLAAGTLVGHLLECGTQSTGGTFTDYLDLPDVEDMGFPIAECRPDGAFVLTKPDNTGGLVSVGTVSEQILYEVSDPAAYFVPDVVCDFTNVRLSQEGPDRVLVRDVRGNPPSGFYKVTAMHEEGWRVTALIPVLGYDAVEKSRKVIDAVLARTRKVLEASNLPAWDEFNLDLIGSGESFHVGEGGNSRQTEVIARASMIHSDMRGAMVFRNETIATGTNGAPGTITLLIPQVVPVHRLNSVLVERDKLRITVTCEDEVLELPPEKAGHKWPAHSYPVLEPDASAGGGDDSVPLIALAWARSGDKGNLYNVGIIARKQEYGPHIRNALTVEAVKDWLRHTFDDGQNVDVVRYDAPGFNALNFVVTEALGGGASVMQNLDCNAKTMGQRLLHIPIPVPSAIAQAYRAGALS